MRLDGLPGVDEQFAKPLEHQKRHSQAEQDTADDSGDSG